MRTRVVIETPYRGDIERNTRYLKAAMADSFARGEAPFASHALYAMSGMLDDHVDDERALGIEAGLAWGEAAEMIAVYQDLGISGGMAQGVDAARKRGARIIYRRLGPPWSPAGASMG